MTLNAHLRSIWRYRVTIALVSVAAAIGVFVLTSVALAKVYSASAEISVTIPAAAADQSGSQASVLFATNTFAQLGHTTPVLQSAVRRSGLDIDHATAESRTSLTPSATVGTITVTAKGPTPIAAQALARSLSQATIAATNAQQAATISGQLAPIRAQIADVKAEAATLAPTSSSFVADQAELQTLTQQLAQAEVQPQPLFAVASPAETSSTPVSPKSTTDAVLAFLTALVVTAELSAFWSFFRDGFSIDNIEDNVAQTLGLPVLAMVPRGQRAATEDAFRELRTNLIFRDRAGPTTKVAVLGVERGVGRTFCAIALARAVSETDTRAGLIDADLRQRAVARALSLPQVPGLSDGLNDPVYLKTHTLPGNERITVLTAGRPVGDPAGLVGGRIASVVFPRFASSEMVVLDTPATAQHPDALAVAPLCDATLIVIDPRTSHRRSTQRLLERLRQVGAHPVGVIVNRSDPESWRPAWRFWRRARASKPNGAPPAPPTTNGHASNGTPPGRRTKKSAIR